MSECTHNCETCSANCASGLYHCRIWYMFTAPSAKYTATLKRIGGTGPRVASSRRTSRTAERLSSAFRSSLAALRPSDTTPTPSAYPGRA